MTVLFDGYLPLLGGQEAKSELKLGVLVTGLPPDDKGNPRAASELTSLKVTLNGTPMPFGLANIKKSFPKTTVSLSPQGKVLKTDAPEGMPPLQLPGLDLRRFPEISYLPIELPGGGLEEGKAWDFKRIFNGSEMAYHCVAKSIKEGLAEIAVRIEQECTSYEDEGKQPVAKADAATFTVATKLTGEGTVRFDLARGLASEVLMTVLAEGRAADSKSGTSEIRRLKTTLGVKLASPLPLR